MSEPTAKKTAKEQLQDELAHWHTKMDEAKVQMHLGAKEARNKIQPHVKHLEQELHHAKEQWNEFEKSSGGAWEDIQEGLKASMKTMQQSFEKAKEHFSKDEKNK